MAFFRHEYGQRGGVYADGAVHQNYEPGGGENCIGCKAVFAVSCVCDALFFCDGDMAFAAEGSESLQKRVNGQDGLHTLEHAEKIGLGTRMYEVVDLGE